MRQDSTDGSAVQNFGIVPSDPAGLETQPMTQHVSSYNGVLNPYATANDNADGKKVKKVHGSHR